jgi:putative nucleotidyltransferase with HDIG domain
MAIAKKDGAERKVAERGEQWLEEAEILDQRGEWEDAEGLYRKILVGAEKWGDRSLHGHVLRKIGEIRRKQGDSVAALRLFHSSLKLFGDRTDKEELSHLYNNIGLVFFNRGKWRQVKRYFGRSLLIARRMGDKRLEGQIFNNLGILYHILGHNSKAVRCFEKAFHSYRFIHYDRGTAQTYNNLGMLARDRGDWDSARDNYEESLELANKLKEYNLIGITSLNLSLALIHLGEVEEAERYCNQAHGIFQRLDDKLGVAESYLHHGIIQRCRGKFSDAERFFKKSIRINRGIKNDLGLAESHRELALLYQDQRKGKQVLAHLGTAFRIFQELKAELYFEDINDKIRDLERIFLEITRKMGEEVESKDTYTYGHCRRVAHYSLLLADAINLSDGDKKAILVAAFLHDLGKVRIPKEILKKPKKLSPDEYLMIMKHPQWGVEILESIEFPWEIKPLILHHQERYDGTGYPDGLNGKKIPLCARIISIADFFDALSTDRPYRKAMAVDDTIHIMERESNKALDPELLDVFIPIIREHYQSGDSLIGEGDMSDFTSFWLENVGLYKTDTASDRIAGSRQTVA